MLWLLWTILTVLWTYVPSKNYQNARDLPLSLTVQADPLHSTSRKLAYSSAELRQIGDLMVRKIPNYYDIRRIKELKINKRRIRLQKFKRVEVRKANLANLACLPRDNKAILNIKNMSIGTVNARSLKQSINMIMELLIRESLDILLVTETWLGPRDEYWIKSQLLGQLNYKFCSIPRPGRRRGGGLMLITRSELDVERLESDILYCESGLWKISSAKTSITLLGVYHPPEPTPTLFIDNFLDSIEHLIINHSNLMLSGDFNLHVNDVGDADAIFFIEALSALGLYQHVSQPTHNKGNILDLIFFEDQDDIKITRCTPLDFVSDHRMVVCELNIKKEYPVKNTVQLRKLDKDAPEIIRSTYNDLCILEASDLDTAVAEYTAQMNNISSLIYKTKTSKVATRKKVPWFNEEVHRQRNVVRSRERCWLKYGEDHQWIAYKRERNRYKRMISYHKQSTLTTKIREAKGDTKSLYSIINNITEVTSSNPLPQKSDSDLASEFAEFFLNKILKIRQLFKDLPMLDPPTQDAPTMEKFGKLTQSEIKSIIGSMKTKSCELDPLPTHIIKPNLDTFLPGITHIVNLSLDLGVFSKDWKCAVVRPLLKKAGLELIYKNYRPVSNLQFLSKLVERCALLQFLDHCQQYHLLADHQSAYRKDAGCETAVTKLVNDILWSMENGNCHAALFMDLSAAFDTVGPRLTVKYPGEHLQNIRFSITVV